MKIKYVEELVGITGKNIRFYEEQGLLAPKRSENGYREYGQEEVDCLMQIKLLRKLGVSIEDIRKLFQGSLTLEECMTRQLYKLKRQEKSLVNMQLMAQDIIDADTTMQKLDTVKFLECVEKMEKEGTAFMDAGSTDVRRKKRTGAIIAAGFVILPSLFILGAILSNRNELPIGVLLAAIIILSVMAAGIIVAVVGRVKEIEGGEEDEASKY